MSAWQTRAPEYLCDKVSVLSIYRNNNPLLTLIIIYCFSINYEEHSPEGLVLGTLIPNMIPNINIETLPCHTAKG